MIKYQIKQLLIRAIKKAGYKVPADLVVEYPREEKYGDYASNVAMVLARQLKKNPLEIAEKIAEQLKKEKLLEKIAVAKPGFINFYLSREAYGDKLQRILQEKGGYGKSTLGKSLKVNVEFISANPTGPLTLGNARGGFYGDVLANVLHSYGCKVDREYFINDRGSQIQILGNSVRSRYRELCGQKESFPKDGYQGDYILNLAKKLKKIQGQKWLLAPEKKFSDWALGEMINEIKKIINNKMKIRFDCWFSERSLYLSPYHFQAKIMLNKAGLLYEKDQALWLKTTSLGTEKDEVLRKSNGEYTYLGSDIPYHLHKIKRDYNILINVFGADNANQARRLKLVVEKILGPQTGWNGTITIPLCQLVRLMKKNKEVRMSKRKGIFVTIEDLLAEIPLDVARFFFLMYSLNTHLDFNLDLAKEKSEKNPVYYVQYAHARISSILRKAGRKVSGIKYQVLGKNLLKQPSEIKLIKKLLKFPELIEEIALNYQVQYLPFYTLELADTFHRFYEKCRVINAKNKELTFARLALIQATQIVLKNSLVLMGISAPEKM